MASAVVDFEGPQTKRILNAAGNLIITTQTGGKKLRRMTETEIAWLRDTKGRTGNLQSAARFSSFRR